MKNLPGIVAPVTAHPTPPDPTREAAIVAAAREYVTALRDWEERTKYDDKGRKDLHRAQRRLVDAVTEVKR